MTAEARFWTPQRRRVWTLVGGIAAGLALFQAIAAWRESHALLINATDSLPNWAFLLEKRRPLAAGDLVFFRAPPSEVLRVHFGEGEHLFGKQVMGMAGDAVTVEGREIFVNGRRVATAKERSRRGVPLAPIPPQVIGYGCFFLATDHPDGFDSRYAAIGIVCQDRILGVGRAIL